MIDTHAHLDFENFDDDRNEVIDRFFKEGGKYILNIGVDKDRNKKTLEISQNNENIFAVLGFHPGECEKVGELKARDFLIKKCKNSNVKAIGEIGLDYFHTKELELREKQKKLFIAQLEVALELDLPVVIHCRDAYEDLLEIISDKKFKDLEIVIHCFSGSRGQSEKFLELENISFSFTGNITFVKEGGELLKVVREVPLKRIMVETDCPFLAPMPHRGKRNEPNFVRFVIEKIAEIKKIDYKKVEKETDKNAINFFNLN